MDPLDIGIPSYGSGIERVVIVTMATATDHLTGEINGTNDRVEHVQDLIGNVHDDVQELKNDLEGLKGEFREFANHAYQQYNANSGTPALPFKIIRFPNGRRPNEAPYSLPPLHTVDDIRNLNDQHTRLYHQEYKLGSPGQPATRSRDVQDIQRKKAEIASHIGYTHPLDL